MTPLHPLTLAGFLGAAVLMAAYFASQSGRLAATDWRFPFANLIGSLLILTSLSVAWNLPSVMIEVFWSAISLYGLIRATRNR
jgi:Na+-translocating ferredoxin:NAD+ oxidoreductase RnfD subunit